MKLLAILLGLAALAFFAAATAWIAYHLTNLQSILNGVYDPLIITASSITILVGILAGISIFFLYKKASLDLRQRKRAEEALRASELNYQSIFNAVNDAVFIYDLETDQILDMNQMMKTSVSMVYLLLIENQTHMLGNVNTSSNLLLLRMPM